jgi:lipase chaperone LimK
VIAHSQLQEIREKIGRTRDPEAERRMRDKQELHDLSTRRIEKWPNTLFAVKKTKESARFEKFRVEEEERRRIDEEEAKY